MGGCHGAVRFRIPAIAPGTGRGSFQELFRGAVSSARRSGGAGEFQFAELGTHDRAERTAGPPERGAKADQDNHQHEKAPDQEVHHPGDDKGHDKRKQRSLRQAIKCFRMKCGLRAHNWQFRIIVGVIQGCTGGSNSRVRIICDANGRLETARPEEIRVVVGMTITPIPCGHDG